jgi:peptide deformylase
MAIRPIVITGDPVLHSVARRVTDFDDELRTLVADMYETMDLAPGVGLAAPQVGVPLRVFVYDYLDRDGVHHRGAAINPELLISPTPTGDADEDTESEGCLSVPGERYPLRRAERAVLTAVDVSGNPFSLDVDGWFARIFQHEFDHLNGVLYVDRLDFLHHRKATKVIAKSGWGKPGASWLPGVDDLEG